MPRHPLGLLGRILLILLLTVAIEFGASTFLYERASRYSIEESDAHRLAEHLVIAEKLLSERPPAARAEAAQELTTDRYVVRWSPAIPQRPAFPPRQKRMEAQVTNWEKGLKEAHLQLRLAPSAHGQVVAGEMRMPDGSWIVFKTREAVQVWQFAIERTFVALVPALLLLTLGALLIRSTLLPLRKLIHAIGHVGSGKRVTVEEEGTAEIRGLIHAFNGMQRRIHELIENRTQALAAVGHDLRTPLARLQLRLEDVHDEESRRAMLDDIGEMDDMIASLLTFLKGEDDPEPAVAVDIAVMAATLVEDATDRGRDATYTGPPHLEWVVRPSMLRRALSNLIENALHYGKSVQVHVAQEEGELVLCVADDGPGIPPEKIEEALQPFVRLDVERGRNTKGMGLGLAIVQQAVALEKGRLSLTNASPPNTGLIAEIRLPG
ncbi:signal transduction histidine kinase [Sphingomonas kyeonggiensis]|uniref:ATP-binding protein n=1 Tax=Sphingomonas kyeonggiensis TaxID=1268553 RepID=UPI0027858033|nr:ATP-binding protein [Sphingomonas kyeonggiensis]MDQ0251940.1 signal transduction histidine kinase [Sphingomonas kyeonggiensis]